MAAPDVCDPRNFPPQKYFKQHELKSNGPVGYDYEYTLPLLIHASGASDGSGDLTELFIGMRALVQDRKGVRKEPGREWEDVLKDVLTRESLVRGTPLDFSIAHPSRIILVLSGNFWRFSREMDPLTTKYDYGNHYFDLQRHKQDEHGNVVPAGPNDDCTCISFFAGKPCRESLGVSHGFSLNIDVLSFDRPPLPITIDPDIQNTGGN